MKTKNIIVLILFFTIILFSCTKKTIANGENREYYKENVEEKYYEIKNTDEFREESYEIKDVDEFREKYYEIKDADEFREKLNLYHFMIEDYYQKYNIKEESEIIKLNISEETLLNMTSDYLYRNDIFNEDLLNSIISVLRGEIRKDYFSEINVFLDDINYGRFLFYYNQKELYILICFYKAAGMDTYFYGLYFLDDSDIN
ncbi:MAG: hypothetical protein LBQ93_07910 [Treponema sp.]|jgi:hypothetical protein|nr:hypothetical protein [Treponema sp.]